MQCINPLHLFAAPRLVNVQDMRAKKRGNNQRKECCPQGHPYSPENTYICTRGFRACRACQRIRQRVKAGWSQEQAVEMGKVPHGHRPVGGKWRLELGEKA